MQQCSANRIAVFFISQFIQAGGEPIMKRVIKWIVACAAFAALSSVLVATGGTPSSLTQHKWRFSPTINAPWAAEDDEQPLDSPILAAGLCRSNPWNTLA